MADQTLTLTLETGDVVIKLRPDLAPGHVERITELAKGGFYDGVVFHRVIPGFMAQGRPDRHRFGRIGSSRSQAPSSTANRMSAACARWRAPTIRTARTASFSSASTMPRSSTASIRSGARSSRAWTLSTPCPRASRQPSPARSSRQQSATKSRSRRQSARLVSREYLDRRAAFHHAARDGEPRGEMRVPVLSSSTF